MTRLLAAIATLGAVVVAVVLVTSLTSSAQTVTPDQTTTTTTTTVDPGPHFHFRIEGPDGFDFEGELPAGIAEFLECLEEEGFPAPADGEFEFDSRDFPEALTNCEFPIRPRLHPFGGEEGPGFEGFPFGEDFGFKGIPFGRFGEGFPFDELPFEDGFGFAFPRLDRDALAECLAELGSFESVEDVRERLDECLPEPETGMFGFEFDLDETAPAGPDN